MHVMKPELKIIKMTVTLPQVKNKKIKKIKPNNINKDVCLKKLIDLTVSVKSVQK